MSRHLFRIRTKFLHRIILGLLLSCLANLSSAVFAQTTGNSVRRVWLTIEYASCDNVYWRAHFLEDMYVDRQGNLYTSGGIEYDEDCLPSYPCRVTHLFVDKYDLLGRRQWRRDAPITSSGGFRGNLGEDQNDNIYVTEDHWFAGRCPIKGTGVQVWSMNPVGSTRFRYLSNNDSILQAGPAAMAVGTNEKIYVSGRDDVLGDRLFIFDTMGTRLNSVAVCPWEPWSSIHLGANGKVFTYGDCAAKYSPDGLLLSSRPWNVGNVILDRHDNTYGLSMDNGSYYLEKLDSNLVLQWKWELPSYAIPIWLMVDSNDNVIGLGNVHAFKIEPDGDIIWQKSWSADELTPFSCEVDLLGNLYVLGTVGGGSDSGEGTLSSYDPDGNQRWIFLMNLSSFVPVQNDAGQGGVGLRVDIRGDVLVAAIAHASSETPPFSYVARYTQAKTLIVHDAHRDPIPNTAFDLIRVHNDPPLLTEDTLGVFETDSSGQFVFPLTGPGDGIEYLFPQSELNPIEDILQVGDTLKIARLVLSKPAIRHPEVLGTQYSVSLDNGRFLDDGSLVFDTVELGSIQTVTLRHTEYRYNLLASLEWDASELYVQGLQKDFRQMSNYLYDVTDGQARLDTVVILDDMSQWDDADIRVTASNVYWPNAGIAGMAFQGFPPITVPRKWFGNPDSCRMFSYLLHPLMDAVSDNFRTLTHELGHYGFAFSDEYLFADPNGLPLPEAARCQARPAGNYGFMDFQYDRPVGGVWASEMSNEYRYQNGNCKNTLQWVDNGRSCWDDFEYWAEGVRNGIFVPIRMPSASDSTERLTPAGLDYFPGPNDDLYALNYDVGRLVRFPAAVVPPAPGVTSVHLKIDTTLVGGMSVFLDKPVSSSFRLVDQGYTTDDGKLWLLGMDFSRDQILTSGSSWTANSPKRPAGKPDFNERKSWLYGTIQPGSGYSKTGSQFSASSSGDSVTLSLKHVVGDYPLVCQANLYDLGWNYALFFNTAFPTYMPTLDIATESGDFVTGNFTSGTDRYGCPVAAYLTKSGQATIWAVDDSMQTYFFSTPFTVFDITSSRELTKLIGPSGEAVVRIDSLNSSIQRAMILSSPYPPLMNGLGDGSIQAGQTHSVSTYPSESYWGVNSISIKYRDSDLKDENGIQIGDETSLRVFRWNAELVRWDLVGGSVDVLLNTVTAVIDKAGTYAVFTMTGSCCRGKTGNLDGDPLDVVDISDVTTLLDFLYFERALSDCAPENDVNSDGTVDIADVMLLLDFLYFESPLPNCP